MRREGFEVHRSERGSSTSKSNLEPVRSGDVWKGWEVVEPNAGGQSMAGGGKTRGGGWTWLGSCRRTKSRKVEQWTKFGARMSEMVCVAGKNNAKGKYLHYHEKTTARIRSGVRNTKARIPQARQQPWDKKDLADGGEPQRRVRED